MTEPVRPVVDGEDPLDPTAPRSRRGPIDPRLLRLAPAVRRHLLACAGLAVATTAVVLSQAEVIARGLPGIVDGDVHAAPSVAGALCVVAVARLGIAWATEVSASRTIAAVRATITERVVEHAIVVDEPGAVEATPPRVTTLVTDGIDALDPWIRSYIPALCVAGILPLAAGARILVADLPSAVILLVAIPLIPVFMVLIGKLAEDRAGRQWSTLQRLAAHFHDVLVGLPTLRLFGQAESQVAGVRAVAEQYRVAVMRTLKVAFLSAAAMELLSMLSIALVAVTIGYRLSVGAVPLGTALVVLLLTPDCSLPIRRVGAAFHAAQAGTDAADEAHEVLATTVTPDGPRDLLPTLRDGVPLLRFRDATVLDARRGRRVGPVDAEVVAGSLVALVGTSGAGKSTLLDVIRCRVPLHRGDVELCGTEVASISRRARTRAIAWIPQLPDPLGADLRQAVLGDRTGAPRDLDVDEVLRSVDLLRLADRPPAALSGGERQRLAVARGVLQALTGPDVRLLLADEPTSHLDAERAAQVLAALRRVTTHGTAVVVATHDPLLIDAADRVVVLAEGDAAPTVELTSAGPSAGSATAPTSIRTVGRTDVDAVQDAVADAGSRPSGFPRGPLDGTDPREGRDGQHTRTATPGGVHRSPEASRDDRGGDLGWFRRMSRPLRWRLYGGRLLGTATELCSIGLTATAAWMVVAAGQGRTFAQLAVAAVAVRTFAIGKGVLRYCERLVSHDATFRLLAEVRGVVVARLGRVAPAGVPGMARGDVMARVVDDVDRLADQELRVSAPTVSGLAAGVVAVAVAAMAGLGFGVAYAVVVVLLAVGLPAAAWVLLARSVDEEATARADLAGSTLELVEHADELGATGTASTFRERISTATGQLGASERRRGIRIGLVEGIAAAAGPLLAGSVVVVDRALGSTVDGAVLGALVLVPFALVEILAPLLHAGERQATVEVAARRLRAVLDAPDPVPEPAHPRALPVDPSVRPEGVTLRWPGSDRPAVECFDLAIDPGEHVRIVGPSGAGKSTVAAALVRFVDVEGGRYLLDDVDVADAAGDCVREVVTWCQQSPWLASTSLRENLHIAAPEATDDEMWAALDAVQLSDWAVALPEGLSTQVGRDGSAMSGGQRQRLALARVLLAGHRIVVLDEPTAHLDAGTAQRVLTDLLDALDGRTVVELGHGTIRPDHGEPDHGEADQGDQGRRRIELRSGSDR